MRGAAERGPEAPATPPSGGARLHVERPPHPELAGWVQAVWAGQAPGPTRSRVLPDGCMDVIFSARAIRGGEAQALEAIGAMTVHREVADPGRAERVGIRFRPGAAAVWLGVDASALADAELPLEALWGDEARRLAERIAQASEPGERARRLEAALRARRRTLPRLDAAVLRAAARLAGPDAALRLPSLAAELGLGERQLRRRFRSAVGLGPKRFARIARFRRALARASSEAAPAWAEIAAEAGFADQPHLAGEFRALAGRSPSAQHALARSEPPVDVRFLQDGPASGA